MAVSVGVRMRSRSTLAASVGVAPVCPRTPGIACRPLPARSAPIRMQRSDRTVHVPSIGPLRLGIAGRIPARRTCVERDGSILAIELLLRSGAKLGGAGRSRPLLLRLLLSWWARARPPVRMEPLMIGARRSSDAAILHRVHCVATGVRVRVRRGCARWLETEVRGHHRAWREASVLLSGAGACALATTKVGYAGHGAELLLLSRVEHHLLERPLSKLLLLLVGSLAGKVALLAKLLLLGKVWVSVKGALGRGGGMGPLELLLLLLGVLVLRGKSVLVGRCERLARQGAFSRRGGHAGRVHGGVLGDREGHWAVVSSGGRGKTPTDQLCGAALG
jgi:hypothetical protein